MIRNLLVTYKLPLRLPFIHIIFLDTPATLYFTYNLVPIPLNALDFRYKAVSFRNSS